MFGITKVDEKTISSEEKGLLARILNSDDGYSKAMTILRQSELRSKFEPSKTIWPLCFTFLGADQTMAMYGIEETQETVGEYYLRKFGYTLEHPELILLTAAAYEYSEDYDIYPLEVLYIPRD